MNSEDIFKDFKSRAGCGNLFCEKSFLPKASSFSTSQNLRAPRFGSFQRKKCRTGAREPRIFGNFFKEILRYCWCFTMASETLTFPRLDQREMAAFLRVKPSRLEWAGKEGIVRRDPDGFYPCETVTAQWLEYERGQRAKGNRRSQLERERAALTRAKRELMELRLAAMREKLVDLDSSAGTLRAVCLRIRSKFQAALPRLARGCYYAPGLQESLNKVRTEFDALLSELSSLGENDLVLEPSFEVVQDGEPSSQAEV